MAILFKIARNKEDFSTGKKLFLKYAESLHIDLSFQNFQQELGELETQYGPPGGVLILAFWNDIAIGCAAVRKFDHKIAELKRMYIVPDYRKLKAGRKLLELCLENATRLGYEKIRLDTLKDMYAAQNLYRSVGFYEIPPYRMNPMERTVYMEKSL